MFIEFSMSQDTDDEKGGEASKNGDEIIRSDKVESGCDEKNFWPKDFEQFWNLYAGSEGYDKTGEIGCKG
jgi:hypothetical protein